MKHDTVSIFYLTLIQPRIDLLLTQLETQTTRVWQAYTKKILSKFTSWIQGIFFDSALSFGGKQKLIE
jgi:hypothetical protein